MLSNYKKRILAFIIDILIYLFLCIVYNILTYDLTPDLNIINAGRYIFSLLVIILLFPYLESSKWQASIGKKILGIKVCDINGKKITFYRACYRDIVFLFCPWGSILYFFTIQKQCLHDWVSDVFILNKNYELKNYNFPLKKLKKNIIVIWILLFLVLCPLIWVYLLFFLH